MKNIITQFSRAFVGLLFIISGLIKLNDPMGFSYKLEEYFNANVLNMEFLIPYALIIACFVVIFEVVLGIMLLIGFKPKFTVWSLFAMIVFFTFLTGYTYLTGYIPKGESFFHFSSWQSFNPNNMKVTDCGCFGDALKLTPFESFNKDLILLIFILILFFNQKLINPLLGKTPMNLIVFAVYSLCLFMAFYVLQHLPLVDFRAYKVGTDIRKGMEIPEGAQKSVYEMVFIYKVNGVETEIPYDDVMANKVPEGAEFIDRKDKLITQGYVTPIHDFAIEKDGSDYTDSVLDEPKAILFITYDLKKSKKKGMKKLEELHKKALEKGYLVIGMTGSDTETIEQFKSEYELTFDYYLCDPTTLKTIERANPSIVVLEKGVITQKVHFNDIDKVNLK
ncbi:MULTISPECIES: BT_3928 family protein [Flavobacterium]|uniref:BT_3928 family protein n=1 Tax=Flavobacterium jumunjinense TaxID=998845 RepID=A0ABV5GQP2_9FLAO|nr:MULTISPECIES: BT_3928 family protein [Flavobacterium]